MTGKSPQRRKSITKVKCPKCKSDLRYVPKGEVCHECYCKSLGVPDNTAYPTLEDAFYELYLR